MRIPQVTLLFHFGNIWSLRQIWMIGKSYWLKKAICRVFLKQKSTQTLLTGISNNAGWKYDKTVALEMKVLILLKVLSCSPVHIKSAFWRVNRHSGSVIAAKCGTNLQQQATRHKKLWTSLVCEGGFICKIEFTFSGSWKSPSELKMAHVTNRFTKFTIF